MTKISAIGCLLALTIITFASPAQSVTVITSTPGSIDFGSVMIGDVSPPFFIDITVTTDPNERIDNVTSSLGTGTDFHLNGFNEVTFAPTTLGPLSDVFSLEIYLTDLITNNQQTATFPWGLQGIGLAQASTTPLPPALPLFVTALGALVLLGWSRKKRTTARAAT